MLLNRCKIVKVNEYECRIRENGWPKDPKAQREQKNDPGGAVYQAATAGLWCYQKRFGKNGGGTATYLLGWNKIDQRDFKLSIFWFILIARAIGVFALLRNIQARALMDSHCLLTYYRKALKTFGFTVIRKYLANVSLTPADRFANRELITFKSGRLSVFLSPYCYAVESCFWGKRYKSLTLDIFVSVNRLNQGYFALYCVTITMAIHVAVCTKQNLCMLTTSDIGLPDIGFSDIG